MKHASIQRENRQICDVPRLALQGTLWALGLLCLAHELLLLQGGTKGLEESKLQMIACQWFPDKHSNSGLAVPGEEWHHLQVFLFCPPVPCHRFRSPVIDEFDGAEPAKSHASIGFKPRRIAKHLQNTCKTLAKHLQNTCTIPALPSRT